MDLRPIFYVIGILLCTLAGGMLFPLIADLATGNDDWKIFLISMTFTSFVGGGLILINKGDEFNITMRQTFLLTTLSWVVLAAAASLPFYFSAMEMSLTDSIFESVSGITTTGSTVIVGLDNAPPGILLWRAILQWLGGIGIIVMALSVLPFLKVGGMQLFQTESSESEKALPRAKQLAASIGMVYLLLTIICMLCYRLSGLGAFDSMAHAMTTIATGGFSTFDSSFADIDGPWAEITATIFMIMGGLPFILYVKALRGNLKCVFKDSQVQAFLLLIYISIGLMVIYLVFHNGMDFGAALIGSSFNIVSLITGTGYTNANYAAWGGFAVIILFFLMVVGGCAGSTTCGIKIFRFQVLWSVTITQLKQLIHPHGVFTAHYNNRPIPNGVAASVMGFFFVFAFSFVILACALSFIGLDFITAMSGAATSIANVGPGLGDIIGPTGTFEPIPDAAKWVMCIGMILGRLELFTVLVLLMPQFWRS